MIPPLDPDTGYLPFHSEVPIPATLEEVRARFVEGPHRSRLWDAFTWWLSELDRAEFPGSLRFSGSFVTDRERPADVDVAVAVHPDDLSVARGKVAPHGHLWTWQNVGQQDPATGEWRVRLRRLQPALGMVDAHYFAEGSARGAALARDWTSEHDDDGNPTGVRKGWLGVDR